MTEKSPNLDAACSGDTFPVECRYDCFFPGALRVFFEGTTLPSVLTTGDGVAQLIDYNILFTDASGDQCVAHGSTYNDGVVVDMVLKVKLNNVDLTKGAGVTLVKGWVDYTPNT